MAKDGALVVLEHTSEILKDNPLGDPHRRKLGVWLPPEYDAGAGRSPSRRRFPVLYDAIALLPAPAATDDLVQEATARDFVADAFAHCKFIGYVDAALPLLEKAGIAEADFDEGLLAIASSKAAAGFVGKLGDLRMWDREPKVKMK